MIGQNTLRKSQLTRRIESAVRDALGGYCKRSPFLLRPITLVPPAAQIPFKRVLSYLATSTIFNYSIRCAKKHSVR